jgi:acetylornithine deacetylase/succinyl-diaminopimelate desuccinylase-like protein
MPRMHGSRPRKADPAVREAARSVIAEDLPGAPVPDLGWGEPNMSRTEKIYAWTSAVVLASISGQPESPVNAVGGTARARIQVRHTVDVASENVVPALRAHLDANGFHNVAIEPIVERDLFPASRTDPSEPWVQRVAASMERTAGHAPNIIPNIGASGPSEYFRRTLGTPIMWIPHSYPGCGQHGPDEADDRGLVGEDPDDAGAALDLLVQPLQGVGRPDLAPV